MNDRHGEEIEEAYETIHPTIVIIISMSNRKRETETKEKEKKKMKYMSFSSDNGKENLEYNEINIYSLTINKLSIKEKLILTYS